ASDRDVPGRGRLGPAHTEGLHLLRHGLLGVRRGDQPTSPQATGRGRAGRATSDLREAAGSGGGCRPPASEGPGEALTNSAVLWSGDVQAIAPDHRTGSRPWRISPGEGFGETLHGAVDAASPRCRARLRLQPVRWGSKPRVTGHRLRHQVSFLCRCRPSTLPHRLWSRRERGSPTLWHQLTGQSPRDADRYELFRAPIEIRSETKKERPPVGGLSQAVGVRSVLLDGSDLELEGHLLGHEHATRFESGVPAHVPVLAIDRGGAFESHPGVAPRVDGGTQILDIELNGLGDTSNGQVTLDPVDGFVVRRLDRSRDELDRRVLLHGEEIVAAEVVVPILVAGVDRGRLDGHPATAVGGVLSVELQGAFELVEVASYLGNHGVAGHEAETAVAG